ncbi:serine hydrolase domain-containing protein [Clostridium felsineum]|uniref:serine hydrolase domain-containing protein n=1 Tax=Clostridium felsineum TaxID=36839 RepID=UPI00098C2AA4|nr:serine hydrolase [Clostridium felsineum]URZ17565.1 Putative D-alanyl-D-alanine carboxypeptidase [Clostridium felsineum DSM 794]
MKTISKFLFFLICIFTFLNLFNSYNTKAKDIKPFLDDVTKKNFDKYKLPSLCVVVVKDGNVVYENSLGYQDIKNKIKADTNTSVYRIGSTSKLFTETAIMQLYEEGKIDLKDDANKYLKDIKIQNDFKRKVIIEDLLTHTSGIDEATMSYDSARNKKEVMSLEEFLKEHPPVVVNEPGKVCLYSNIGIDLLGRIIENVSGMKYEDYIQKNIFDVLNMKNSTVGLPINNLAKNYNSLFKEDYYYYNDNPAGGINASPKDMGKFMIAQLQKGTYKNNKILNEKTIKLMQQHHFSNDKNLSGIGYGFFEKNIKGKRLIGHEGALAIGYFDDMLLDTEDNLGIYIVSNNLTGAAPAINNIENSFFNKYIDKNSNKKVESTKVISSKEALRYVGTYRSYHDNAKSNILKFISFLGAIDENEDVKITYDDNNLVYHGVSHLKQKETARLIKVSNNLFRRADNNELVAFRENNAKIKYVFFNNTPYDSFEKVGVKDNYALSLIIFIVSLLVFVMEILKGFISIFKRKEEKNIIKKVLKRTIFFIGLLNIVSLFGILYWIVSYEMYYGITWYIKTASLFLIISIILTVFYSILSLIVIIKEKSKIYYNLIAILKILVLYAFVFSVLNWNLLKF